MDRFGIVIERQEQLEAIIREWGFLPFFKSWRPVAGSRSGSDGPPSRTKSKAVGIEGFSIEEMTPPELLFGDDFYNGPWMWKGDIISHWESAYGKFFNGKAGYVSLEWLPDFINWRRSVKPLQKHDKDARHIYEVLVENESMISRRLKKACGFTLSRKNRMADPEDPTRSVKNRRNGMAFDSHIARLEMSTYVCVADFEYLVSKKGETYGWGLAHYSTPEAMYPELFPIKERVDGRTPEQSRDRIIDHLCRQLPDVDREQFVSLI